MIHYNAVVSRYKCLLQYLSTSRSPPVDAHKWMLVYKQIMNENVLKHRCNNIKYVLIEVITNTTLKMSLYLLTTALCYKAFIQCL